MKTIKTIHFIAFFMLLLFQLTFTTQINLNNFNLNTPKNNIKISTQTNKPMNNFKLKNNNNYPIQIPNNSNKKHHGIKQITTRKINNNFIEKNSNNNKNKELKYSSTLLNNNKNFSLFLPLKNTDDKHELIEYTGEIEFLSFNTLIAFPDKIFNTNNSSLEEKFDTEKITPNEFKNILTELYLNNYILISTNEIFTQNKTSIFKNKIHLPKSKKPIILSFDNVTYKSNYQNIGSIDKIIIDRNDNIATYSTKKSIQDRINYDNEFIVILENFIKEHPSFSFNGARGIIFLTGENGILGYNTNHKNASGKIEQKRASKIIKKLSSLGWEFGSNNYTYSLQQNLTDLEFAKNISLWNNEVKGIINDTNLFALPHGNLEDYTTQREEILYNNGFQILFYTDDKNCNFLQKNNLIYISRREINGKTIRENKHLSHLFNCKNIYDHTIRTIPFPS